MVASLDRRGEGQGYSYGNARKKLMKRPIQIVLLLVAVLVLSGPGLAAKSGKSRTVTQAAKGSPEALIASALVAAQDKDEKKGFDAYKKLVHPDRRSSAIALVQLRRYSWKRFRAQAADYILGGTTSGFVIVREEPERASKRGQSARLFIDPINNAKRTYPVPIRFKKQDGDWYILSNSL
ncbi:MAG: hypothetical protein CL940_01825 [Deltaproteobacteria bacterium]|nr:hypothetical protein [Deltaproteobacteria bacterium]